MNNTTKNYLIIVLILAVGILGYAQFADKDISNGGKVISPEKAVEDALLVINQNFMPAGVEASLISAIEDKNGVYSFTLSLGGEQEIVSYLTKDGRWLFPEAIDLQEALVASEEQEEQGNGGVEESGLTVGNFSVHSGEVCLEDGKPLIYFFGSEGCGFCQWEHPVIQAVAQKFEGHIAFHDNLDSEQDRDVFEKYNPQGAIPTLVFGCKYSRVGAGTNVGEEAENKNLTALICHLTGNQPSEVCQEVADLVSQINE